MLCLCLVEEIIDKEEFVLLYDTCRPRNLPFPHSAYEKFSLANKDPAECKADFRVEKRDIPLLADALTVPPVFRCRNGTICDGAEGLCIMLKRFAYPCRYSDIIPIFGRSVPELSVISNEVVDWMYTTHGHKITQWNHDLLNPAPLNEYADAISNKGAALENCFGFIDGTVRPISRPDENQIGITHRFWATYRKVLDLMASRLRFRQSNRKREIETRCHLSRLLVSETRHETRLYFSLKRGAQNETRFFSKT